MVALKKLPTHATPDIVDCEGRR